MSSEQPQQGEASGAHQTDTSAQTQTEPRPTEETTSQPQAAAGLTSGVNASDSSAIAIRAQVEAEQALADAQRRVKALEDEVEKANEQKRTVEGERDSATQSTSQLRTQLSTLQSSYHKSNSELSVLQTRIEIVEREKKELIEETERLQQRSSRNNQDLYTLRAQRGETAQKIAHLDVELSEQRMAAESAKFNEDRAQQALLASRAEVLRLGKAAADIEERFGKYRVEKQSQLSALQTEHDIISSRLTTAESSYQALQRSYNEQSTRLAAAHADINNLTSAAATRKASTQNEMARLVEENRLLAKRADETRATVNEREVELERIVSAQEEERRETEVRVKTEERRRKDAEKRSDKLKSVVDRLALAGGTDLSPAAALAGELRQQGKSYTQFFTEYTLQEGKLQAAENEVHRLTELLDEISGDIAEKKPLLDEQAAEHAAAIERANALAGELATVIATRDVQQETIKSLNADSTLRNDSVTALQAIADDLSRQVQSLLRQLAIRDDPLLANVAIDANSVTEGDVITDHLLEFKSLRGLQEQNVKLLKLTRALMAKLEQREIRRATAEEDDFNTADSLDQAAETIEKLHKQLLDANKKINEATRERDFFSKLLARGEGLKWSAAATNEDTAAPHQQTIDALRVEIEGVRVKADEEMQGVREELKIKLREVGEAEIAKARAEAKASMLEEQSRSLTDVNNLERQRSQGLEEQLRQIQSSVQNAQNEARQANETATLRLGEAERLRADIAVLRAEKEQWTSTESRLQSDFRSVQTERTRLQQLVENLNGLSTESERTRNEERVRIEKRAEELQRETTDLRAQLLTAREATREAEQKVAAAESRLQTGIDEAKKALTAELEAKHNEDASRLKQAGLSWKKNFDAQKLRIADTAQKHSEEIANKDKEVEKVKDELAAGQKQIEESKTKLAEVESKLTNVSRAEQLKEQTVQRLQSELSAARGKSDNGAALNALQTEKDNLQKRIAQLETELAEAKATPSAPATAPTATTEDTPKEEGTAVGTDWQKKHEEVAKNLALLEEKYARNVTIVNKTNTGLKAKATSLEQERDALLATVADLQKQIKELESAASAPPASSSEATETKPDPSIIDAAVKAAVAEKTAELNDAHAKALAEAKKEAGEGNAGKVDQGAIKAAVAAKEAELKANYDTRLYEAIAKQRADLEKERDALKAEIETLTEKLKPLERTLKTADISRRAEHRVLVDAINKKVNEGADKSWLDLIPAPPKPLATMGGAAAAAAPATAATAAKRAATAPAASGIASLPANPTIPTGPAGRGRGGAVRGRGTARGGAPGSHVLASVNAALSPAAPSPPAPAAAQKRPAPEEGEIAEPATPTKTSDAAPADGGDVLARLQGQTGEAVRGRIKRPRGAPIARGGRGAAPVRRTSQGGQAGAGGSAPATSQSAAGDSAKGEGGQSKEPAQGGGGQGQGQGGAGGEGST